MLIDVNENQFHMLISIMVDALSKCVEYLTVVFEGKCNLENGGLIFGKIKENDKQRCIV